jgi:purine-binding chemotaxis protein CheW
MKIEVESANDSGESVYLTFRFAGEHYAISINRVREVVEFHSLTKVPGMPPWIAGLINLRGTVVPVIDLGIKFGFAPAEPTRWSCIVLLEVILEGDLSVLGVIADAVGDVIQIAASNICPPPSFGSHLCDGYLAGMTPIADEFVLILDTDRVLSIEQLLPAVNHNRDEQHAAVTEELFA